MMFTAKFFQHSFLFLGVLCLGACDLYEESWTSPHRVQLKEERFFEAISLSDFDSAAVSSVARSYDKHGEGDVALSVTYDPQSPSFGAMDAGVEASRLVRLFQKNGIHQVRSGVLPVGYDAGMVLVSFKAYSVEAPKDCSTISGLDGGSDIEADEDYALGCTVETIFARQLARPKDLAGGGQVPATSDGRRVANSVESYRDGLPNEPFDDGESASGE